ncbi:MAG: hypothetical protein ABII80_00360, partial [bacterium]
MNTLLGFLLFSFAINSALIVPFINLLYNLKFQRPSRKTSDLMGKVNSVFNYLHKKKSGTPVGGGILIILTTSLLYLLISTLLRLVGADGTSVYDLRSEVTMIFAAFLLFGLLGLYDDIVKFFDIKSTKGVGMSWRTKLAA